MLPGGDGFVFVRHGRDANACFLVHAGDGGRESDAAGCSEHGGPIRVAVAHAAESLFEEVVEGTQALLVLFQSVEEPRWAHLALQALDVVSLELRCPVDVNRLHQNLSGDHLVKNRADGPGVVVGDGSSSRGLVLGHVLDRTGDVTGFGDFAFAILLGRSDAVGNTKVHQRDRAFCADEDVGGFEVAVYDPSAVQC